MNVLCMWATVSLHSLENFSHRPFMFSPPDSPEASSASSLNAAPSDVLAWESLSASPKSMSSLRLLLVAPSASACVPSSTLAATTSSIQHFANCLITCSILKQNHSMEKKCSKSERTRTAGVVPTPPGPLPDGFSSRQSPSSKAPVTQHLTLSPPSADCLTTAALANSTLLSVGGEVLDMVHAMA